MSGLAVSGYVLDPSLKGLRIQLCGLKPAAFTEAAGFIPQTVTK